MAQDQLSDRLGWIAFHFRGTRDSEERKRLATEYEQVVNELIESGIWDEVPGPEDELPYEWMPRRYFEYWGLHGS